MKKLIFISCIFIGTYLNSKAIDKSVFSKQGLAGVGLCKHRSELQKLITNENWQQLAQYMTEHKLNVEYVINLIKNQNAQEFTCTIPLTEQFKQTGYLEIHDEEHGAEVFDSLYIYFDELIKFLQTNPTWEQKLYIAKERFIRSKERNIYSTDFFGFYDESKIEGRSQIAFYYSTHFHEFICSNYPEFNKVPEITHFFQTCCKIQKPYANLFNKAVDELGLEKIFSSTYNHPPILFKVIKYLPTYAATKPHYDGTAFSIFLDSTDNDSLLLSPYKALFTADDFSSPKRKFSRLRNQNSILLIPGTHLGEFSINPTPHIVIQSGKTRYATIAFAMRPNYIPQKIALSSLPDFKH